VTQEEAPNAEQRKPTVKKVALGMTVGVLLAAGIIVGIFLILLLIVWLGRNSL